MRVVRFSCHNTICDVAVPEAFDESGREVYMITKSQEDRLYAFRFSRDFRNWEIEGYAVRNWVTDGENTSFTVYPKRRSFPYNR